jgi:hypothetical protein
MTPGEAKAEKLKNGQDTKPAEAKVAKVKPKEEVKAVSSP